MKIVICSLPNLLRCLLLGFLCLALVNLGQAAIARGQEAAVTDFTVSNSESHLLLYLTITDSFKDEMVAAIHNGIPITFTFFVNLAAKRSRWPDRKIRQHEFNHIIEYDSLKKQYIIQRSEKEDKRITASLEEAQQLMAEINGFEIIPLDELEPQLSYTVRAKAKLARKTLPLYFHYLVPFSSPWDFETKWHELTLKLAL